MQRQHSTFLEPISLVFFHEISSKFSLSSAALRWPWCAVGQLMCTGISWQRRTAAAAAVEAAQPRTRRLEQLRPKRAFF
jgi:hypothetical protein